MVFINKDNKMLKYYYAVNTGKGFITHEENESAYIKGYPGDIYVTENEAWASRVSAIELTKDQAQAIVNEISSQTSITLPPINPLEILLP